MNKHLCPNCDQGRNRLIEEDGGYYLCGLCKRKGWVFSKVESYSTKHTSIFNVTTGMDVLRVVGLENEPNEKSEEVTAQKIGSKFLGYKPYYKTLIQNDIN